MIADLHLQRFRSYKDDLFEFGDGVNIIVGPNASGKTNLLEGILVLCRGSTYKGSDRELIKHKSKWARLDGQTDNKPRTVKLELVDEAVKKQHVIGGSTYKRLPLERTVPVVVFEPSHLQLLTESPELRRNFLDDLLEQTIAVYGQLRRQYKRALAQRNALLKQATQNDQLFAWNVRLSELGGQLANYRLEFVSKGRPELAKLYNALAGPKGKVDLEYQTKQNPESYASSLLKLLEERLPVDRERGYTTVGPHRDDLIPMLDGYPLSAAASRGETRTMLLALKILEVQKVEQSRGTKPILLLDDVFSELDGARRRALTDYMQDHQTFITTTDADVVVRHFLNDCKIIPTTK